ncbi:MAG: thymidylate synthase [Methanospirillaceae archaeon]|nr:thymidylate synthase [Methanospirillaceae archaeon]
MELFACKTISQAHEKAIRQIIWKHRVITTEDGEETWETDPLCFEISDPMNDMIHPSSSFQENRCQEYARQLIHGDGGGFDYSYNERLRHYVAADGSAPRDQIGYVIQKLKKEPDSRRAVAITWRPEGDWDVTNVPCLQFVQYAIRNGKLHCYVLFRSEDILSAFGPNCYGLCKLQEFVSEACNIPMGTYNHIATIPHLYNKRDRSELDRWM